MITTLFNEPASDTPLAALCAQAVGLGFRGVGLCVGEDQILRPDADVPQCQALRAAVDDHHLDVTALMLPVSVTEHFGAPASDARTRSIRRTDAALERAARLGATTLIAFPALVQGSAEDPALVCGYADALNGTHAALQDLRFEAERRGVSLALAAPWGRFLLSPVETRELIDAQHSPAVGVCLILSNVLAVGCPLDWIHTLGCRLHAVLVGRPPGVPGLAGSDVASEPCRDFGPIAEGLRELGFTGVLAATGAAAGKTVALSVKG